MTIEQRLSAILSAPPATLKLIDAVLSGDATSEAPRSLRLLSMGDACRALGVSRPTLWRLLREGRLSAVEVRKGSRRVPESELARFVEGRT